MSNKAILALIFGVLILLVVLVLGLIRWKIAQFKRKVAEARRWPTAPGRIVGGTIVARSISLPRGGRGVSYLAVLAYEYQAAGQRQRSERYSLSGPIAFSFRKGAQRLLDRFPAGTAVTVSYDPAAPGAGVISISAPHTRMLHFIFWFCLGLFGWLIGGTLLFEPVLTDRPIIRL